MNKVLHMQGLDAASAPAGEKASKVSLRWCNNSQISVIGCFKK